VGRGVGRGVAPELLGPGSFICEISSGNRSIRLRMGPINDPEVDDEAGGVKVGTGAEVVDEEVGT